MKRKPVAIAPSTSLGMTKRRPMPPPLPKPPSTPYPGLTVPIAPVAPPPPPPPPPPITNYRSFLNNLAGKPPANLTLAQVGNWQDIDPTAPSGLIVDEIAKKFNNHNKLGINNVTYNPNNGDSYYSVDSTSNLPKIDLSSKGKGDVGMTIGADPRIVGHELVHANDHQIDQLNPRVWQNLLNMAQGIAPPVAPATRLNRTSFEASIGKIQKKIDPASRVFFDKYKANLGNLQQQIADATRARYALPFTGKTINWPQLHTDIQRITSPSAPPAPGGAPNTHYALPFASEFPAFMTERLTNSWGTNTAIPSTRAAVGSPALSRPEARFIHSTLGDMDAAYPAADYPVMNHYIRERRNSIERAYEPTQSTYQAPHTPLAQAAGLPAPSFGFPMGTPFYGGGLAKKHKKSGVSDYLLNFKPQ